MKGYNMLCPAAKHYVRLRCACGLRVWRLQVAHVGSTLSLLPELRCRNVLW
jgi:hypothetical protein